MKRWRCNRSSLAFNCYLYLVVRVEQFSFIVVVVVLLVVGVAGELLLV